MKRTDEQVVALLRSESLENRVRKMISASEGAIEQAMSQRKGPGPVEIRRREFEAVDAIVTLIRQESGIELASLPERNATPDLLEDFARIYPFAAALLKGAADMIRSRQ